MVGTGDLAIGDTVSVVGLQGAQELNGRCGQIVKFVEETHRFGIRLDGETAPKALRPANLQKVGDGVEAARTLSAAGEYLAKRSLPGEALLRYAAAMAALEASAERDSLGLEELRQRCLEGKAQCHLEKREWWEVVLSCEQACPYTSLQSAAAATLEGRALRELGLLHSAEEKFQHAVAKAAPPPLAAEGHEEVVAAIRAVEVEGLGGAVLDEVDRLRKALPEKEAVNVMHTAQVKCKSEEGQQEMIGHGFLKKEWLDLPQATLIARTMHKFLVYQVKKRLQQELSLQGGSAGVASGLSEAQYTFATPRDLQHSGAAGLLTLQHVEELKRRGLTTVEQAFDLALMVQLRQECETLDRMGILRQDNEDVCNPLQRRFDIPLGNRALVDASRSDTPVLFEVLDQLRGLPAVLEERLGLQLRVPETVMLACYPQGAFYRKHLDSYEGKDIPRKVTILLYCNPDWSPGDGGALRVWCRGSEEGEALEIEPIAGRLVVFMAQEIWHEVTESSKDRYALTQWVWDVATDSLGR